MCLTQFGTPVHEVGHALGLVHTQMRADRDDWITIVTSNIISGYLPQYQLFPNLNPLGVPYDLDSVMQYSPIIVNIWACETLFTVGYLMSCNTHEL